MNDSTPKSLFIGRWQPFHDGHKALIQTALDRGKKVLIAIRETPLDEKNPYTVEERAQMIKEALPEVEVMSIPDIDEVIYGRDVGYKVIQERLSPELEAISGTKIRDSLDNR